MIKLQPGGGAGTMACWSAVPIQDLVLRIFGVEYHPHYLCTLLHQNGVFVSEGALYFRTT
ncbi:MAG: hypothetical protein M9936_08635 [Caldilinea sp.]|nr:hypothetical protein [Caldilinea sp.]